MASFVQWPARSPLSGPVQVAASWRQAPPPILRAPEPLFERSVPSVRPAAAAVLSSRTGPDGGFVAATKRRYVLPQGRFSEVQGARGEHFFMSHTLRRGHYGKLRLAVDVSGAAFAVKEFRLPCREVRHKRSTQPSSPAEVMRELELLRQLGERLPLGPVVACAGKVYALTPLYAGSMLDLRRSLAAARRPQLLRHLLAGIAECLVALHARGFVHCDIKPDNVLYHPDGAVALCDFGMATAQPGCESRSAGTFGYMAPEYVMARQRGCPYDVFSLGITLGDFIGKEERPQPRDWAALPEVSQALMGARAQVVDEQGALLSRRLARPQFAAGTPADMWQRWMCRFFQADPALCAFVVVHLLHPEPARRPTGKALQAAAAVLRPGTPPQRETVARCLRDASRQDQARQRLLGDLDAFRRRRLGSTR